jgi:hypothetical protein
MTMNTKVMPSITLYRGWIDKGAFVWSPFVTKVEVRLRFAGLSYINEAGSPRKAPKGKIPCVDVTLSESSRRVIADSTQIIGTFVSNEILPDLNDKLSPSENAHDLALRALIEDKLYFYQVESYPYNPIPY